MIIIIIIIMKKWLNKCENWNFRIWKLNSEIGILKNYLNKEFKKRNK